MSEKRYVIVGAGIAGLTAAETVRRLDPDGEILLLSREKELPYARPMLSKAPLLSMELKPLALHGRDWYAKQNIDLRLGVTADRLDPEAHLLCCGGEAIPYDKCVLATGAGNFIPPFPGREDVELLDLRTLDDLRRLRRRAVPGGQAVVIGGGVIGLELASELQRYRMEVTVLEAMDRLMPRLIDAGTSAWLVQNLPIQVVTGVSIAGLRRDGAQTVVEEKDGRTWKCDLLAVSCGVRAETALARSGGLACERAITVDERMQTSAPDVYACGDCAAFRGFNAALWSQALAQGRVAGENAAGGSAVYTGCDTSLVMTMDGLGLFALGNLNGGEGCRVEELRWQTQQGFLVDPRRHAGPGCGRLVYKNEKPVGVALLGDLTGMQQWKQALLKGGTEE